MKKILIPSFLILFIIIHYYGIMNTLRFSDISPPINLPTYFLFCYLPLTIFFLCSFSSPKSIFHKIVLTLSMLSTFTIPLIFSNLYPSAIHIPVALFSFSCSCKMLIWLKDSLRNDSIMVKPFIWSLFYWRPKEGHILINKQQDLLEKGIPQALLRSYINYHYKKCFFS